VSAAFQGDRRRPGSRELASSSAHCGASASDIGNDHDADDCDDQVDAVSGPQALRPFEPGVQRSISARISVLPGPVAFGLRELVQDPGLDQTDRALVGACWTPQRSAPPSRRRARVSMSMSRPSRRSIRRGDGRARATTPGVQPARRRTRSLPSRRVVQVASRHELPGVATAIRVQRLK